MKVGTPELIQLRELSRLRDELMAERPALANRLSDHLNRYFPEALRLGNLYDNRWIWSLLERAPTPQAARKLSLAKLRTVLQSHRIRNRTPEQIREILQAEPLHVAPGVVEAFSHRVVMLLPRLRLTCDQLLEVDRELDRLLENLSNDEGKGEHRDVALALSFPGIGTAVCVAMFGEAWQPLAERDYKTLAALSGTSPSPNAAARVRSCKCVMLVAPGYALPSTTGRITPSFRTPMHERTTRRCVAVATSMPALCAA